jgi:hypothetical protein
MPFTERATMVADCGKAVMLHRTGLAAPIDLAPLIDRLQAAGLGVSDESGAMQRFHKLRRDHAGDIDPITNHLGVCGPVLIPDGPAD